MELPGALAEAGQMLALDPPDGGATIGGVVATGDSGPLRARYGGVRDLLVGMRIALADGTVAKSGGKVIKNVAGYDLAKLFVGSFGTPGAILSRFGGAAAQPQAEGAGRLLSDAGLDSELVEDDDDLWRAQRDAQRSPSGLVVRVSALQTDLAELLRVARESGATLVGRAGLGIHWLRLDTGPAEALVARLRPRWTTVVLDHPPGLESGPHEPRDAGARMLAGRVKERFDPEGRLL